LKSGNTQRNQEPILSRRVTQIFSSFWGLKKCARQNYELRFISLRSNLLRAL
jgi:hypothetical protein